jgi:hypothetical protein
VPAGPSTFSFRVSVPPAESTVRTLTATFALDGGTPVAASPATLAPAPPVHHADLDGDHRIDLADLTRVIELFNTRHGTVRTGY